MPNKTKWEGTMELTLRRTALRPHGHALFAMCAYAFRTEPIDGQEGFTILSLPTLGDSNATSEATAIGPEVVVEDKSSRFLLWENTAGSI